MVLIVKKLKLKSNKININTRKTKAISEKTITMSDDDSENKCLLCEHATCETCNNNNNTAMLTYLETYMVRTEPEEDDVEQDIQNFHYEITPNYDEFKNDIITMIGCDINLFLAFISVFDSQQLLDYRDSHGHTLNQVIYMNNHHIPMETKKLAEHMLSHKVLNTYIDRGGI
jgi:hypothetical protein